MIRPVKLTHDHVLRLAPSIREEDLLDLKVHGSNPYQALEMAEIMPGEAWAVVEDELLIGAGGWTEVGSVWTLWANLSLGQAKEVLHMAAPWCRIMAIRAKRPLGNIFLKGNRATERFLRATKCVDILEETIHHDGREWTPFFLKPLEAMPSV